MVKVNITEVLAPFVEYRKILDEGGTLTQEQFVDMRALLPIKMAYDELMRKTRIYEQYKINKENA